MRKYRNTKIVKSILLGLPVLFCSCYNNDSIKNGHCEDEKDFRYENGVVKIYGTDGTLLNEVKVNDEDKQKIDYILQRTNGMLNDLPQKQQTFVLNNFDVAKGYEDFVKEFRRANVKFKMLCLQQKENMSKDSIDKFLLEYMQTFNVRFDGIKEKNGHRYFRLENGMVKIYGNNEKLLKVVVVNEVLSEKLNGILDYFNDVLNDVLKNGSENAQQFIFNQFDTTMVYKTLSDFCVEFCLALFRDFKNRHWFSNCSKNNMDKLVEQFWICCGNDLYNILEIWDKEDEDKKSFIDKFVETTRYMQIPSNNEENLR